MIAPMIAPTKLTRPDMNESTNIVIKSLTSGREYSRHSGFLADRLLTKFHSSGLYGKYEVYIEGELHAIYEMSPDTTEYTTIGVYT